MIIFVNGTAVICFESILFPAVLRGLTVLTFGSFANYRSNAWRRLLIRTIAPVRQGGREAGSGGVGGGSGMGGAF